MKALTKNQTHKKRSPLYIPWYAVEEDITDEGEEDSWINYLRRNISHTAGEESAFPESSWSYTESDSYFDDIEENKITDDKIHDHVMKVLYENESVDASNIKVIVLNGLVSLFGSVKTIAEKNVATKLIKPLNGVWGVRNELDIIIEQPKGFSHVH